MTKVLESVLASGGEGGRGGRYHDRPWCGLRGYLQAEGSLVSPDTPSKRKTDYAGQDANDWNFRHNVEGVKVVGRNKRGLG